MSLLKGPKPSHTSLFPLHELILSLFTLVSLSGFLSLAMEKCLENMHPKFTNEKCNSFFPSLVLLCIPFPLMMPPLISLSKLNTWVSSLTLLSSFPSPHFLLDLITFLYSTIVQAAIISLDYCIGFLNRVPAMILPLPFSTVQQE